MKASTMRASGSSVVQPCPTQGSVDLACLISVRNFGDAAGHSWVLSQLAARGFARRYLVWTKPAMAFLFDGLADCDIVASPTPTGSGHGFRPRDVPAMWRGAKAIRKHRPDVTFDLVGDQRERWLARLAGSRRHLHIGWAPGHEFNHLIRNPFGDGAPFLRVPAGVSNVYAAYRLFVERLCPQDVGLASPASRLTRPARPPKVGLHPFASQACKLWPGEKWAQLADALIDSGHEVVAFCAPPEMNRLQQIFAHQRGRMRLQCGALHEFAAAVASLDLMIGLDSFSVHMAHLKSAATVMLNAGNPPSLWVPPGGIALGQGGGCPMHPCYNVPSCKGSGQYVCVRSISVNDVIAAVARSSGPTRLASNSI